MNIVLLFGGYTERDVSIMSAKEVESSLKRLGHKVTKIDISKEDFCHYSEKNIDLIFNNLAVKPSKKSHNIPRKTNNDKDLRSPFNPQTTAIQPKNRFKKVSVLGKIERNFIF